MPIGLVFYGLLRRKATLIRREYLGKGVALSSCTKHVCNSVKNNLYNPCWNFEEILTFGIDGTGPDLYV